MQKRKLAAIMFTDIQGYTAVMQQSEDKALQFRSKHREVFDRETLRHNGEILQYYGDGTLSVFDSAVDAVKCGVAIQQAMLEAPAVPVRIGIHSGDIIFSDDDIIGDGVNVASRIESLAVVGSVLISDKVYDEVKNSSAVQTQFLKIFKLKNVERPVGVYAVANSGLVIPDLKDIKGKVEREDGPSFLGMDRKKVMVSALLLIGLIGFLFGSRWGEGAIDKAPSKKVAVLPFEDISGKEEDYFPEGMTEGLIDELSKIDALTVLNQKSTKFFVGADVVASLISSERDQVDFFVQGVVNRNSNQLAVDLALKTSPDADPVWTQSYERDLSEVRQLWAQAAEELIDQMGIQVQEEDALRWANLRPVNPETYEFYLKGIYHIYRPTPQDRQQGLFYLQEAVNRNPADAYAYAGLAEGYIALGHGPAPPPDVFPKALAAAERAIQLDSNLANGWAALAHYHTYFGWDWELAEYAFNRANELNPNLANNHYHRAWYLALFGRMNEAIEEHKRAQELDPFTPLHTAWLGALYRMVKQYEKGLAETERVEEIHPNNAIALHVKGMIYADMGKMDLALKAHKKSASVFPPSKYLGYANTLIRAGRMEEAQSIIQELESMPPTPYGALCLGILYSHLEKYDKALEWFNYEEKHGWYPWMRVNADWEKIGDDPRFLKLLRDMGLPDPAPLQYDPEL